MHGAVITLSPIFYLVAIAKDTDTLFDVLGPVVHCSDAKRREGEKMQQLDKSPGQFNPISTQLRTPLEEYTYAGLDHYRQNESPNWSPHSFDFSIYPEVLSHAPNPI